MHILLLVQQTVQLLWNSQNGSQRHRWLVIFPSGVQCIFVSVLSVFWTYFLVLVLSSVEFWGRDAAADSFTFQWESSGPVQSLLITSMQRPSLNSFNTRLMKRICLNRRKILGHCEPIWEAERGRAICKPILLSTDNRVERSAPDTAESFSFQSESWKLLHFRHFSALVQC